MSEMNTDNRPVALRISGVKKMYKLGQIGGGTLRADLQSWWAKKRGKEDPNTKIGQEERLVGQTFMALNGVDFTVYQGEAVGIIGGNGAGKSTLLKLISQVTAPTAGQIELFGRVASMLEVGTGFNGEMTGRENVYMNGAILGMTKEEIDAKMEDIIEFSEVRDFIDTPVKRYSSGMYVKLAFSVAAHLDSEIMIMDEVLAVGDVNFQQKCLKKMRDAASVEGRTVLYVSHNMNTIRQLCDRCVVLDKGKKIFDGDVDEAINLYSHSKKLDMSRDINLTTADRIDGIQKDVVMTRLSIDNNELSQDERLNFTLHIDGKRGVDNAILRFVIFDRAGMTIGATYSKMFSLRQGENIIKYEFNTQNLAPNEYTADIILCEYDGEVQIRHDIVLHKMAFTIEETKERYNMKWNKNGWGTVYFDEIEVR